MDDRQSYTYVSSKFCRTIGSRIRQQVFLPGHCAMFPPLLTCPLKIQLFEKTFEVVSEASRLLAEERNPIHSFYSHMLYALKKLSQNRCTNSPSENVLFLISVVITVHSEQGKRNKGNTSILSSSTSQAPLSPPSQRRLLLQIQQKCAKTTLASWSAV